MSVRWGQNWPWQSWDSAEHISCSLLEHKYMAAWAICRRDKSWILDIHTMKTPEVSPEVISRSDSGENGDIILGVCYLSSIVSALLIHGNKYTKARRGWSGKASIPSVKWVFRWFTPIEIYSFGGWMCYLPLPCSWQWEASLPLQIHHFTIPFSCYTLQPHNLLARWKRKYVAWQIKVVQSCFFLEWAVLI